jgi:hypothetical protein
MKLTDRILITGFAAIITALGMIAENQVRHPFAPWGSQWFDEAAGIFRNEITDMVIAEEKGE